MNKKWKWGTIVPLIGGMTVANKMATGNDPAFLLSYPAFAGNDSHCKNYFKDTPYLVIDPEKNELDVEKSLFANVDFVSAVCPCAGLSMLNNSKGRGPDAIQNEWMYKSAKFVLEKVQPKVFWGENAPGLYSAMGVKVAENLRAIGKEFGYSFSLVKTDTYLHGIPQHRTRTFYFFWKDSEAPILNFYKREAPMLEEYLNQVPENATHMDRYFGIGEIKENPWFVFAKEKEWDVRKLVESNYKTMINWVLGESLLDEFQAWCEKHGDKSIIKFTARVKNKRAQSLGFWDGSPLIFHDATNAIITKNTAIIHPGKERGITIREAMYLMGLPNDFEMTEVHTNHICQNVPVTTAADWTREILRFLKGEFQEFGGSFVKQNNISQKIDYETVKSKMLF